MTVLRWGGLAGVIGSLSLVSVFGFLAALVGLETLSLEEELRRYPEIRHIRVLENAMYLAAIALWSVHTATLFVALRRASLAPALIGCVLMGLGLTILAAGALPHTMTDPISDLYHGQGASPELRSMAVTAFEATQGIVDTLVITGLALTPFGMGFLGLANLGHPGYRPWFGWISIFLALVATFAAISILMAPSDIAAIGMFAVIFFNAILGWRTFRLSQVAC